MSNNQLRRYSGFRITNGWVRLDHSQSTSYILYATLEIENQMLFLVLFRGSIMLSLGKKISSCFDQHRSTGRSLTFKVD